MQALESTVLELNFPREKGGLGTKEWLLYLAGEVETIYIAGFR